MSLVKKSDVKNHLSPHYQKEIHLDQPLSEPDATGFSVEEPARTDSNIEEQRQQASSIGLETSPGSVTTVAPRVSKSGQA